MHTIEGAETPRTVRDLIEILSRCDPDLPIATHANNHTFMVTTNGSLRVGLLHTYAGDHVVIGNISKLDINGRNYHVAELLDGGPDVPRDWTIGGTRQRMIFVGDKSAYLCTRCHTLEVGDSQ